LTAKTNTQTAASAIQTLPMTAIHVSSIWP
jgi:hypothetical protein